ncbi:MAG TPA: SRPBCC family protein [Casimicrobiaceae bacterium]|jgi:uncharacterized protein YndB with AHSA1/START domain
MANDRFVYVTYIRTTPQKLWDALTKPEFTRAYWYDCHHESRWEKGAEWRLLAPEQRLTDSGEILEIDPPRRLVVSWRNEISAELKAEGYSRCTFEIEAVDDAVKLTVIHEIDKPKSKLIAGVSEGWPSILSSLKSLLETGESLETTRHWPKGM